MTPPTTPTAVDFAQVRQQYPNAFEKLRKWLINTPIPRDWDMRDGQLRHAQSRQRDLYDFFDEQGVYVAVAIAYVENNRPRFVQHLGEEVRSGTKRLYPTRTAAEAAAFTAGFGKLEEMLNKGKG